MSDQPNDRAGIGPSVARRRALSRRSFFRGAGIAMSLPLLDAMSPAFAASPGRPGRSRS